MIKTHCAVSFKYKLLSTSLVVGHLVVRNEFAVLHHFGPFLRLTFKLDFVMLVVERCRVNKLDLT